MEWLKKLIEKLAGYKTYILGVGAILTAIGAYLGGTIDAKQLAEAIWAALIAMGIRHGVTTEINKVK